MRTAFAAAATAGLLIVGLGVAPAMAFEAKDSPLTPTLQELAQNPATATVRAQAQEISTRPNGRLVVDVRMANTGEQSLERLTTAGANVKFIDTAQRTVTIAIDAADLPALAAVPGVESAREVLRPMTNATCPRGAFTSEGLTQLRAALATTNFHVTGRDVTVGILSDSYNALGDAGIDVANGELPGLTNPCGNTAPVSNLGDWSDPDASDEGRAMAQIVHDLAPDATLKFATAFISEGDFAQNIRDLAAAGADIIVDDITYFDEPMYQDGIVAKAVADVVADGVAYFSSAANSNEIVGGKNVASYEAAMFRPVTCPTAIQTRYSADARCHDFDPEIAADNTYGFSVTNARVRQTLGWSEPAYGIDTDLDLCLTNNAGNILGCGDDDNLTTELAFEYEFFPSLLTGTYQWVIVRPSGTGKPPIKMISHRTDVTSVEYDTTNGTDVIGPTIFGHNASRPGVTVAAVPFDNENALEDYSSWGPAKYCWGPVVGTSPASSLSPCQSATVDLTATDGVQNSFFGAVSGRFHRFYGTSAAAPHAAAAAALMLDREQCLTPAEITTYLGSGARSVGTATVDGRGAGLVDVNAALTAAGVKDCDNLAPVVTVDPPRLGASGWYTTASVEIGVAATDRRTVSDISCTFATVSRTSGLDTPNATGTATTTGEGTRVVNCHATDGEGNTGASLGSDNVVSLKIDSVAPALACRPLNVMQGQPGTVTADVTDATSGPVSTTASAPVVTSKAGTFIANLTAKDKAGNTGSAGCAYTVTALPDTTPPVGICRPLTVEQGKVGTLSMDVTDSGSGPSASPVSIQVTTSVPGDFTATLTGLDNAGNSTTVACPYTVTSPSTTGSLTGPAKAKVGSRKTYRATGLPATVTARWTLTRKGKGISASTTRTSTAGTSTRKVRFPKKGRYVLQVKAGGVTLSKAIKVR